MGDEEGLKVLHHVGAALLGHLGEVVHAAKRQRLKFAFRLRVAD